MRTARVFVSLIFIFDSAWFYSRSFATSPEPLRAGKLLVTLMSTYEPGGDFIFQDAGHEFQKS